MKTWTPLSALGATGIPMRTLQRWCRDGKIRAKKFGKRYYVNLHELLRQNGFSDLAEDIVTRHTRQ